MKRKNIFTLIKIFISVACIVIMFKFIGVKRMLDVYYQVNLKIILLAFLITPICLSVKIYRWYLLAKSVDSQVTFGQATLSYLAGLCLAVITPFATGELARGCYFEKRAAMTGKVFIDKLVDLTVVTLFTLIGVLCVPDYPVLKVLAVIALGLMVMIWSLRRYLSKILTKISERKGIASLERLGEAFATVSNQLLGKIFGLAIIFFGLFYFQAYVILRAFGSDPSLTTIFFFPIITLSTIIPITFGGVGIREWTAVILLQRFGIPDAVAASTFFTHFLLINFIPALIGAPFVHKLIGKKESKK